MPMYDLRLRRWPFVRALAMCLLLVALASGCGRGRDHDLALVSGRVTLHGEPMASVNVTFQPLAATGSGGDAGLGSYALTDSDGRFQMKTVDGRPGAVVGKHRVWLTLRDHSRSSSAVENDMPMRGPPNPLPRAAYDGSLTFEVPPGGTGKACFEY